MVTAMSTSVEFLGACNLVRQELSRTEIPCNDGIAAAVSVAVLTKFAEVGVQGCTLGDVYQFAGSNGAIAVSRPFPAIVSRMSGTEVDVGDVGTRGT